MTDKQVARAESEGMVIQAAGDIFVGLDTDKLVDKLIGRRDILDPAVDAAIAARIEDITRNVVESVADQPDLKRNFSEPSVLRALTKVQTEYATYGDDEDADVYVGLLKNALAHPAKDMVAVAAQRAIEVVASLSEEHKKILAALFVAYYVRVGANENVDQLRAAYSAYLAPLAGFTASMGTARYLDSVGVVAFDTTQAFNFHTSLSSEYANLFGNDAAVPIPDALSAFFGDDQVLRNVIERLSEPFSAVGGYNSCFLTNIGKIIAHAYITERIGLPMPAVEIWVR